MFGRGMMAAMAAATLVMGVDVAAPASRPAILPAPAAKAGKTVRRRTKRKPRVNRFAFRSIHRRGNKLGRRLARKVSLGRNGSF